MIDLQPSSPTQNLCVIKQKNICLFPLNRFAIFITKLFHSIISFFSKYCGRKTKCGYKFEIDKRLTPQEASWYLPYVSAAAYSFCGKDKEFLDPLGWRPIYPSELDFDDPELRPTRYSFFDKKTGLKIAFAEKEDEVLFAIPGLISSAGGENHEKERSVLHGILRDPAKVINILGGAPYVYTQAERAITNLLKLRRFRGKKITLIGQCFGGSIASYVSLKTGVRAICFNSLQLGAGLQAIISDENLKKADQLITHIMVDKDWLTTSKTANVFDRILTWLHIRTPGNFGKKYSIPTAYTSSLDSHGFVLGSMMAHLGYDKRETPRYMPQINSLSEFPLRSNSHIVV